MLQIRMKMHLKGLLEFYNFYLNIVCMNIAINKLKEKN